MRDSYISMCAERRVKLLAVMAGLMLAVMDARYLAVVLSVSSKITYIITAVIFSAVMIWYISGLVKLIRGNVEGGIETIRKYVKTLFVITTVLSAFILVISVLMFVLSFSVDPSRITVKSQINISLPDAPKLLKIVPLISLAVCALLFVMVRGINNSIRFASDVIKGNTPVRKPGRAPEIIMLISVILSCIEAVILAVTAALSRGKLIIDGGLLSLLQFVLLTVNSYIQYTIFRDIRKIAESN